MGGTMYDIIRQRSANVDFIDTYLEGGHQREEFRALVDQHRGVLQAAGLNDWEMNLLRRFPPNEKESIRRLFDAFSISDGHEADFIEYKRVVAQHFEHLPDRYTSIFPEETRSAYELSRAIVPKSIVVAGSYYAYLAVWLLPGMKSDGRMTCIDPDPSVCELAAENMRAMGYEDQVDIVCDDAIEVLKSGAEQIDLLVIDAYGSTEHPDPRRHGKAIYAPIASAAQHRLSAGSTLLVHNADETASDLDPFFKIVSEAAISVFLGTTEHLAVFQL